MGAALLRSLLTAAKLQGFEALSLSISCNNPAVIRRYERDGLVKLVNVNSEEYPSWAMKVGFTAYGKDEGPRRTEAPVSNKPQG